MFCILSHVSCISESQNSWPWTSRAHWNEFGNTNQRNSETQSCTGLGTFSLPGVREWPPTFNEFRWSRVRTVGMTETWSAWAPLVKWFVITFAVVKPTSLHIPDANAPSPKPQLPRIGDGKGPNHNVVFALGAPFRFTMGWTTCTFGWGNITFSKPSCYFTLHYKVHREWRSWGQFCY